MLKSLKGFLHEPAKKETRNSFILLFAITLLAGFIRFYRIRQNLIFEGEMGFDYLQVANIWETHKIPLLGPPTSHPWLQLSPFFYWIFALLLKIGNFHPIIGAYFYAVMGVVTIPVAYFTIKYLANEKVALISSFLISISPNWVRVIRHSRFNAVIPFLFFPFLYFLVRSIQAKGKDVFWTGIVLGFMYSFFPAPIVLIPATLFLFFIYRKRMNVRVLVNFFTGFFIPNIPFLIYNIENNFKMVKDLLLWIPYRIAGFFGLIPSNNANPLVLSENLKSFYEFFSRSFFANNNILVPVLFFLTVFYVLYKTYKASKLTKNIYWFSLISIFLITYLGLFLHGDPPLHYYYIVFPFPILITSHFLNSLRKKRYGNYIFYGFLLFLTMINLKYYFSSEWFFIPDDRIVYGSSHIPFELQDKVTRYIANDAAGREFQLKRVGSMDDYPYNLALNYHYLLWRLGNRPKDNANLIYTIYDDYTRADAGNPDIHWISNVAVEKKEL